MIRYRKWKRITESESSQTYVENHIPNTATNIHSSISVFKSDNFFSLQVAVLS